MTPRDMDVDIADDQVFMPYDLAAKWDALGPERELFRSVVETTDLNYREHVKTRLEFLRAYPDWTVGDAVRLAVIFPKGLGILGTASRNVIPELWHELDARFSPKSALHDLLSLQAWADRDIPAPDRLLGDGFITTTTRTFIVGRTGLGKTGLALGIASGIAAGTGFLHWRSVRPARVLYVDGEMPGELIKARSVDALRRAGERPPAPGSLTIYSRDMEEQIGRQFPTLGRLEPLNTEGGHDFMIALIDAIGGVDLVIFDNVMSLVDGDQKDELSWSGTLPLITSLTAMRVGQLWLDHTGHNSDRQYGSSTKSWRFDTVGVMTPLPDAQREPHEMAFTLSFDHPGKARRRTPSNWSDFDTTVIRLRDDRWTSDLSANVVQKAKVSPTANTYHRALLDAIATGGMPGATTLEKWYRECVRHGLVEAAASEDTRIQADKKRAPLRKYRTELKVAGWIGVDGDVIRDLTRASAGAI